MPPMRIREHAKAKKGTMKRLLKQLFKLYPIQMVVNIICIAFNAFSNLCSSIFLGLITSTLTEACIPHVGEAPGANGFIKVNPFVGSYDVSTFGGIMKLHNVNVTTLLIFMISVYVVAVIASFWWNRSMAIITQRFLNEFRKAMFNHMEDLPIKYFDTHAHGSIMSVYTNDIDTIRQFISQSIPEMIRNMLTLIFCFGFMLICSLQMTAIVIGFTILSFFATKFVAGRASKYFILQQRHVGIVEGNIEETMQGLKVIKVFSHEEKSFEEFKGLNEELRKYSTTANSFSNVTGPINGNIGNFMYISSAIMGALIFILPSWQNWTILGPANMNSAAFYGTLLAFLMMVRMFSNNINMFSQQITFIVLGMAGASRCFDLMDEEAEKDEGYVTLVNIKKHEDGTFEETNEQTRFYAWKHPHQADGTITYTELKGDILLDHVDFSYNGVKMVLNDVSVYANPGQKIALVGATGAGKTTITNLINRFYDIADGKIRYDGININKIKKADLRRSLGIVLQDTNLFTGTVMENIRYGKLDATDEEVIEASKIANAYDFITRLPDGFNTVLTGDGANLSQGQRQLLSIARAAVADAPVMILDEATSSIDTRTEKLVQDGMDKLMKGRTVFVIAHRLSTIKDSDAIMVMEKGRIIERGTHDSLIEAKGTYYRLYTGAFELE